MKSLLVAGFVSAALGLSAEVVENVGYTVLSDGRVEISYTLNTAPVIVTLSALSGDEPVDGINFRQVSGDVNKEIATTGTKKIWWRPADDTAAPDGSSANNAAANALLKGAAVRVTAWQIDDPPDVMVVDLSDPFYGDARVKYYEDVASLPGGLLDNPVYRFQKLVMKRVRANGVEWLSGCAYCGTTDFGNAKYDPYTTYPGGQEYPCRRKLDHDYYCAVFELTKGQHSMLAGALKGGRYNLKGERFLRPADSLSFIAVRGGVNHFYPEPPDPESILGRLRSRTGIKFDLPGEYEWEFAAWAGHGPDVITYDYTTVGSKIGYWGNGTPYDVSKGQCRDDGLPGRYACNSGYYDPETLEQSADWSSSHIYGPTNATAYCGSYSPNDFGLYDMHGNVSEWCLDYYTKNNNSGITAPINANGLEPRYGTVDGKDVTTNRVVRGGSYLSPMKSCRSSYRGDRISSFADGGVAQVGCRVVCPIVGRMIAE